MGSGPQSKAWCEQSMASRASVRRVAGEKRGEPDGFRTIPSRGGARRRRFVALVEQEIERRQTPSRRPKGLHPRVSRSRCRPRDALFGAGELFLDGRLTGEEGARDFAVLNPHRT